MPRKVSAPKVALRLYITGSTPKSAEALANIKAMCEAHFAGRYDLEVIDLYQHPEQAALAGIIAAPTLVKQLPPPVRRLVGDLTDTDRLLLVFDLSSERKA